MRIKTPRVQKFANETEDLGEGRIRAIVSTEAQDRDGDIIRQSGWDLHRFQKHPILLVDHNYADITKEIGRWESMKIDGDMMIGEARYFIGKGNEVADWAYFLASEENMAAFSVGFLPDWEKAKELEGGDDMWPHYEFKGQELLEVSQVTVPSNPEALQLALNTKTLIPTVRKRIERLLSVRHPVDPAPEYLKPEEEDYLLDALADEIASRLEAGIIRALKDSSSPARKLNIVDPTEVKAVTYSALDKYLEISIREAFDGRH